MTELDKILIPLYLEAPAPVVDDVRNKVTQYVVDKLMPPKHENPNKQATLRVGNTLGRAKEAWITLRQLDIPQEKKNEFGEILDRLEIYYNYIEKSS